MKIIEIKKRTVLISVILSLLFCIFATASLSAQQHDTSSKGIMTFTSETIDYGTIAQNSNGVRVFSFINTGNAPIVISKIKTSCGCTIPSYEKKAILPGETSDISVKYATNRIGAFSKRITIISNAMQEKKALRIKGIVEKPNS
ncbi:MAG: DUF1573 domain-containing protein [Bacteroidota bacterium]